MSFYRKIVVRLFHCLNTFLLNVNQDTALFLRHRKSTLRNSCLLSSWMGVVGGLNNLTYSKQKRYTQKTNGWIPKMMVWKRWFLFKYGHFWISGGYESQTHFSASVILDSHCKKKHMIILFGTECIIEIPIIENFVLKFLNELFGGFLLLSAITHFSYADIHGSGIGPQVGRHA